MARIVSAAPPYIDPQLKDLTERFKKFVPKVKFLCTTKSITVYRALPWWDIFNSTDCNVCRVDDYETYHTMKIFVYDYTYLQNIIQHFPEDNITIVV